MTTTSVAAAPSISRALEIHARCAAREAAVIDGDGILTFRELFEQARARAGAYANSTRRVVAIPATSTRHFFVDVAAAWLAGAIPMPLDPRAAAPLREAMIRRTGTTWHDCHGWKAVLCVVGGTYRPLVTGGEAPTDPRKAHAVGLTGQGAALFAAPMYLNGPFEFAVRHLLLGGTVVMLDRFAPARWAQAALTVRPRWVFLAPIQIARLLDGVNPHKMANALVSVDTLLHTSAPCPPELRQRLLDLVEPRVVAEFYGAAAYDGTFTRAHTSHPGAPPIPGADLRIVDAARQVLPAGAVGTIEGRSTTGLSHHWAGTSCADAPVWHTVGDHGHVDDIGRLTVTSVDSVGRAIVGGVNVALARVHAVIAAHPAVLACHVLPTPDSEYGQVVTVRAVTDRPVDPDALAAYCATRLRPAERPRHFHVTGPGHVHDSEDLHDAAAR
jgi:acyl-CoA synthetase (AMP-forming)/AMP-acid ligase II